MQVVLENKRFRNKIHPHKFALWVACGSITMMFAAFTSAYMVRQAAGNWLEFRLPGIFFFSAAAIVLSSIALHGGYLAFKTGRESWYKRGLLIALVLGLVFVVLQYKGWLAMEAMGIEFTGNPSGSFVYVISGIHAAHVLGGIGALTVALLQAYKQSYRPTAARQLRFELTLTYWHFVGALWIYLVLFFVLQHS